jgi:hypothetical protein
MRVPIENGLGLSTRYQILLSSPPLPEQSLKELLSENDFSCGQVFIFSKYMIHV